MSIKFGGDKRDRTADLRSASASLSQTELYPHYLSGAGNEVRTRDIQLGRLTLYQLSYSRIFIFKFWWRGQDLNLRPSGYEPDELPDCSTPHYMVPRTGIEPVRY